MKKICLKFLLFSIVMQLSMNMVLSLELDMSVDEEIRKKYDTSKLEDAVLPPLPKIDNTQGKTSSSTTQKSQQVTSVPKSTPSYIVEQKPVITPIDKKSAKKIFRWTTFETKSNQKINNWLAVGSSVSFTTTAPVYKKNITIPIGTVFKGTITNVHKPQLTGNGGLVVIKITSMSYNGKSYPVSARIVKANAKNIYLNNIKGQRQYWVNAGKQVNKGESFYKKTRKTSAKLADNPIGVIISPVPTAVGIAGYALNTAISPITSIFAKGGNLSIPAGSIFEIRLNESAYIY